MTCHADCIRVLAAIGMNVCLEVWSLSKVMQPHTVYNKHKELLRSCYWKLEENPTYAHWTIIFGPWHNTCEVTNSTARRIQEPNFCHDNLKTLPRWDRHIRVLWDYVKNYWHFSEIIVLHFMLWLSFRLWVWQREPHFLNSLPYLFIVMCAVLCHDQKLNFLVV